jgi:hypothetical protein
VKNTQDPIAYGNDYFELRPTTPWNFGLIDVRDKQMSDNFKLEKTAVVSKYPWSLENSPLLIRTKARRIPAWSLYNDTSGPVPYSISYQEGQQTQPDEEIILVPYGCTQLRISQFPVVGSR